MPVEPQRRKCLAASRGSYCAVFAGLLLAAGAAHAGLVCTTTDVGNRDFNGISGSSDSNVIGVGRNGTIYRFDGTLWTAMTSGSTRHLEDVEVVDAATAWAVGRNGEVLRYDGTAWSGLGGFTNEELFGVWSDSGTEAWTGGDKGEIWYFDGSTWTDQQAAAGADNRDIADLWGDGMSVWVLNDRGQLYRYDRSTASWDPPDTTCEVSDKFTDLWGDGAGNLFLTSRDEVYRYDGSTCTVQTTGSEDLNGISGNSALGFVYAVGKDGSVVSFDGALWLETFEGTRDFNDDWVSASGSVYYAGDNGEVTVCQFVPAQLVGDWRLDDCSLDFPASVVVDSGPNGLDGLTVGTTALEADGAMCSAVELDGAGSYISVPPAPVLDLTDGVGFAVWVRHDGTATSDWDAIFAKGDSAYRLHLNGGCTMADMLPGNTAHGITFGLNGGCGNADLNSNVVPVPDTWYHVAGSYDRQTMRIYINGVLINWSNHTQPIGSNGFALSIGENLQQTGRQWSGDIDELTLWDDAITPADVSAHMNRTRPCANCSSPVLSVMHDGNGIHCLAESVTIDVTDSLSGAPFITYNEPVTLDTQVGSGTWVLVTGSGVFSDATPNDGVASYDWPLGESSATFALSYPAGPASVDIDVFQSSDASIRDDDSEGPIAFGASGFTLTALPMSNPPPVFIAPFATPQVAGTDFAVALAAYGQTPNDPECGIIETYTGPKSLNFWFDYADPSSGTIAPTVDGVASANAEAGSVAQAVSFVNGQAQVTARYKDAGRIQLNVKDATTTDPALPTGIRGATAPFVVRPARFRLSAIADGGGVSNPAAANASGAVFTQAGAPFSVTVTAVDAVGDTTPNFGREVVAESVRLSANLVAPLAGNNPPIAGPVGFGAFAGGSATGIDFSWAEVGIITLIPSVLDGDYLGAGDVVGNTSGNVGRFIPARFDSSLNAPSLSTACAPGSFTYIGEPFGFVVPPVISLSAQALSGSLTQNYAGAFFKLATSTLANRSYASASGSLNTMGLPSTATDPAVAELGAGAASLTFDTGAGLLYDRGAAEPAFDADLSLSIDVLDADGVAATNPVTFAAPIAFDNGPSMRYGRLRVSNGVSSELVSLALPMRVETFVDAATGFVTHVDDACTAGPPLTFGAYTLGLDAGETCVVDSGSPGGSGAGCAAPGLSAEQFRTPALAGDFNLRLAAPGAGNGGSVTVGADAPPWLEFDWDAGAAGLEDPVGTATFGIYSGTGRQIYLREVY